jgi:hypothetical protein
MGFTGEVGLNSIIRLVKGVVGKLVAGKMPDSPILFCREPTLSRPV